MQAEVTLIRGLNNWRCRKPGCPKDRWNVVGGLSLLMCWRHATPETKACLREMGATW